MEAAEFILYVADQARAAAFYRHVLAAEPVLDVPGMTEFSLGGATLGLMPVADMEELLAGQVLAGDLNRLQDMQAADRAAARSRDEDLERQIGQMVRRIEATLDGISDHQELLGGLRALVRMVRSDPV